MKERWGGDAGARKPVRPNLWAARIILHNTCIAFLALGPVSIYREALAAVSRDTRGVSGLLQHVRGMLLQRWLLTLIFFRRHDAHFIISRSIGYERFLPRVGAPKGKSILTHLQKQAVGDCQTLKLLTRQLFMNMTKCIEFGGLDLRCHIGYFRSCLANIAPGRPASNSSSHKLWHRRFYQLTKSSPAWWPPINP